MKRILLFILFPLFLLGQARTYLPIDVVSSSGRGFNNQTVVIYPTGTTTGGKTLTYLSGSNGAYYWTGGSDSVSAGAYDIYVNGILWRSNISLNENILSEDVRDKVLGDSDATGLDGVGVYEHLSSLKVYNVLDYGAYSDSTNAAVNRDRIQVCIDSAWADGTNAAVYFPPGIYAIDSSLAVYPMLYYGISGKSKIKCTDSLYTILTGYTYDGHVDNTKDFYFKDLILEGSGGYNKDSTPGAGADAGCINVNYSGGSTWLRSVTFDNIYAKNIMREALQAKNIYRVVFKDCEVDNCNFDAYNPANVKEVVIGNCIARNSCYGIETYVKEKNILAASPDLSNIVIDNFTAENIYHDGIVYLGGNDLRVLNSNFSFYDTTYTSTIYNSGIRFECLYNETGDIYIQNTVIDSAILYGIHLKNSTYNPNNVIIDNCRINNSNRAGIVTQLNSGRVTVRNSKIKDFNREGYNGITASGIYIVTDNTKIFDNEIALNDTSGLSITRGYDPIFIYQSIDSVTIEDNDFRSSDGRNNKILLYNSNVGNYFIRNNMGLGSYNAIETQAGDNYYQLTENKLDGYYISEFKGEKAFAFKIINNDSLCIVEYASDGSATDTSSAVKTGYDEGVLTDYSFESWASSTNLNSWTENGVGSGDAVTQCDTAYKGSYSVKMTRGNDNCYLTQQVSVDSANSYRMRFYTKGDGSVAGNWRVYDSTNGLSIVNTVSTGIDTTAWTLVDSTFAVSDSTHLITVYFYSPTTSDGSAYFDTARLIKR